MKPRKAIIDGQHQDQDNEVFHRQVDVEVVAGGWYRYRPVSLFDCDYDLLYPPAAERCSDAKHFTDWIMREAQIG